MTAPPPRKLRPQLPEGPYLVVGLARSGQAVARLLAERGGDVTGVDSGHLEGAAGLREVGVEVVLDADGLALLDGARTVVKSPGVPRETPVIAAALERGIDDVLLLSPACASFDAFESFEQRGERFGQIVESLP
jgi:UDP-N-acetylmuramoylalanine-D-glutamate ligase